MELEYKTYVLSAESCKLPVAQRVYVGIVVIHMPFVGRIESPEKLKQCCLAGSARPYNGYDLTVINGEVYAFEYLEIVETLVYVNGTYHTNDLAIVDMAYSGDTRR